MTKARKVALGAYGIGLTVVGLSYLLLPEEMAELQGAEVLSAYLVGTKMVLGATLVAVGLFVAMAARDPIHNILWVRFAIVFALLFVAVSVYLGLFVKAEFREVLDGIFIHGTFAALLLLLYPRQVSRGGQPMAPPDRRSETRVERGI